MTDQFRAANVAKGALYYSIARALELMLGLAYTVVIARVLTQEDIGIISLLAFTASVFTTLTLMAIPSAATRFISAHHGTGDSETAGEIVKLTTRLVLLVSTPALTASIIFAPQIARYTLGTDVYIMSLRVTFLASLAINMIQIQEAQILGLGKFSRAILLRAVSVILNRFAALTFAVLGLGVLGVTLGWAVGGFITAVLGLCFLFGQFRHSARGFPLSKLIGFSLPLLLYSIIGVLQSWIDVALFFALTGNLSNTGVYYLVVSITSLLLVISTGMSKALMPALAPRFVRNGFSGLSDPVRYTSRMLNLFVLPLGAVLSAISTSLLHVAFGEAYVAGNVALSLLASTAILQAYTLLMLTVMEATGQTKILIPVGVAATAVDTALVVLLSTPLGIIGSALARIALHAFSFAILYIHLSRKIHRLTFYDGLVKSLLFSSIVGSVIFLLDWQMSLLMTDIFLRLTADLIAAVVIGMLIARSIRLLEQGDFDLLKLAFPKTLHGTIEFLRSILAKS